MKWMRHYSVKSFLSDIEKELEIVSLAMEVCIFSCMECFSEKENACFYMHWKFCHRYHPHSKPLISTSVLYVIIGVYVNPCQNLSLILLSEFKKHNWEWDTSQKRGMILTSKNYCHVYIVSLQVCNSIPYNLYLAFNCWFTLLYSMKLYEGISSWKDMRLCIPQVTDSYSFLFLYRRHYLLYLLYNLVVNRS